MAEDRDRLFAAWLEGLDALAAGAPAAWLVEDVHWASADLLAFLDFATREPAPAGRIIVGTTRPSLLESAAEWCRDATVLHLEPLPSAQTAQLVRGLVGDVLPDELVERIADRSGGNALFVEELLRTWASTGVLAQDDAGGGLSSRTLRTSRFPRPCRPSTRDSSTIYHHLLEGLLVALRLQAAAFRSLRSSRSTSPMPKRQSRHSYVARSSPRCRRSILGASYVYRHALLRDAGYASLARGERASLHVQLAQWLTGLHPMHSRRSRK